MFSHWFVTRVGLPREVWEPLRVLHYERGVPVGDLAASHGVSELELAKVLLVGLFRHLEREGQAQQKTPDNTCECFDGPDGEWDPYESESDPEESLDLWDADLEADPDIAKYMHDMKRKPPPEEGGHAATLR